MTAKPEAPVKDASRLPVYTEDLGAFLRENLAAEWAYTSGERQEHNGSCHADSRIWFLSVSCLADGLYRTNIRMYGHGCSPSPCGVGGQAACPGDADAFAIESLKDACAKENPPSETFPERALREFKQMFPDPGVSYAPTREFEHQGCKWRIKANPLPRLDGSFVTPWRVELLQPSTQRYWHADGNDCLTAFNNVLRRWAQPVQDDTPAEKMASFGRAVSTALGGPAYKDNPWFQNANGDNIHDAIEARLRKAGVDVRMATSWLATAVDLTGLAMGASKAVGRGRWELKRGISAGGYSTAHEHAHWFEIKNTDRNTSWHNTGTTYWEAFWNAVEAVGESSQPKVDPLPDPEPSQLPPHARGRMEAAGVNLEVAAKWMDCAMEMAHPAAGRKEGGAAGWRLSAWQQRPNTWTFEISRETEDGWRSAVEMDSYWDAFWACAEKVGKASQIITGVDLATGPDKTVAVTMTVDKAPGEPVSVKEIAEAPAATRQTFTAGTHDTRNLNPDRLLEAFKGPPMPLSPAQAMALGQQFLAEFGNMLPTPEGQETMQARRVGGADSCRVRLCVYEYGNVMAAVMRGVDEIGRANASKGGKTDDRIAYAKEQAVMAAVQKLSEGYEPPSQKEVNDKTWREYPKPREDAPEEYWPASDHGGYKWLG